MSDPVILADGYSYERDAIVHWLRVRERSPITGATLSHAFLLPNHNLRLTIRELLEGNCPSADSAEAVPDAS